MRLELRILGCEVLAFEASTSSQPDAPIEVHGPPFGFSGSAICQAEYAGQAEDI